MGVSSDTTTRRRFLKAVGTAAAACHVPSLVPSSVLGANAPSKRINLGLIGCGHQSQRIVPPLTGLRLRNTSHFQGLTPLAIDYRPLRG